CWAEALGYSCCEGCEIAYNDGDGNWGVENDQWCGIDDKKCNGDNATPSTCFADEKEMGYPCCEKCDVAYTDDDGDWGVENNDWCSVPYKC
ncbi:Non-catalytic module family DOC2, partial [Piromyces sp. E2]